MPSEIVKNRFFVITFFLQMRSRRLCFTWYGDTPAGDELEQPLKSMGALYAVWQREKCPSTGREHFQGYARFRNPVTTGGFQRKFPGAHCEVPRGSEEDNTRYCTKEDSRVSGPWRFGVPAAPGKRTDLEAVKEVIKNGGKMVDVIEVASSYQSLKGAELILKYQKPRMREDLKVYWFHGATGSGKTREVYRKHDDLWCNSGDLKWFDGYDDEKVVLFDDFRPEQCKFSFLLKLLDIYPLRVPIKGGFKAFNVDKIYVTCPYSPQECYKHRTEEDIGQLIRRIHRVRQFGSIVKRPDYSASAPGFRAV